MASPWLPLEATHKCVTLAGNVAHSDSCSERIISLSTRRPRKNIGRAPQQLLPITSVFPWFWFELCFPSASKTPFMEPQIRTRNPNLVQPARSNHSKARNAAKATKLVCILGPPPEKKEVCPWKKGKITGTSPNCDTPTSPKPYQKNTTRNGRVHRPPRPKAAPPAPSWPLPRTRPPSPAPCPSLFAREADASRKRVQPSRRGPFSLKEKTCHWAVRFFRSAKA